MRRFFAVIVNILAATAAIVSLSLLHMEYSNDSVVKILSSPGFEKSSEFADILSERVNDIFSYITLKNCFETNGELNYTTIIAESIDKNKGIREWTIQDCLEEATKHGLYIGSDFTVDILSDQPNVPFSRNNIYNFVFKTYPSKIRAGASNEEEFLTDFMSCLAEYHKCKYVLNKANSNFAYRLSYYDEFGNEDKVYENTELSNKDILNTNAFVYIESKENLISTSVDTLNSTVTLKNAIDANPNVGTNFSLHCFVDTKYPVMDDFRASYNAYSRSKNYCAILLTAIIYSGIVFIISLALTIIFILATKKTVDGSARLFYIIPTEFYIVAYIVAISSLCFATSRFFDSERFITHDMSGTKTNIYLLIIYITTILLFTILAAKYENDSLMPISLKAIKENTEHGATYLSPGVLFLVIFIPIIIFIVLSIYMIYLFSMTNDIRILTIGIIMLLSTIGFVIYLLVLHNAFDKAIEVQVKSNEMRTSLIANVSHDIKTPLTTILNYTNLISEEINNPSKNLKENLETYSNTIINKSHRLNDLINDLIFDSKVTSGNVELNMVKLDLNAFISQIVAEFEDRLLEKGIKVIYTNSALKTDILADSSQLYRVFQNLFTNIYKYALENSRVYVDLESNKSKIIITIKNIQKEKLEVDPDTLTDRFVRGNKSRTTEGFGLGLSISESLILSMNGKFVISSVRDLFTVRISFIAYEE